MGIKIDSYNGLGYRVKLDGDRRLFLAESPEAASIAILHYYARPHDESKCPLCQDFARRNKKGAKETK